MANINAFSACNTHIRINLMARLIDQVPLNCSNVFAIGAIFRLTGRSRSFPAQLAVNVCVCVRRMLIVAEFQLVVTGIETIKLLLLPRVNSIFRWKSVSVFFKIIFAAGTRALREQNRYERYLLILQMVSDNKACRRVECVCTYTESH